MLPDVNIARIDHARDAFPSERILRRFFHRCGCITICDRAGRVVTGVACFQADHRQDIVEPTTTTLECATAGCEECRAIVKQAHSIAGFQMIRLHEPVRHS